MQTCFPFLATLLGLLLSGCGADPATRQSMPPAKTNTLGMQLVLIPAGEFLMGGDASEAELVKHFPGYETRRLRDLADEAPVHRVRLTRPFYMARHEVTVGQFRRFLDASGHVPESIADGTGGYGYNPRYDPATTRRGDAFEGRDPRYSWRNPGFAQGDDHPVVNVTWNDAQALAAWLSRVEQRRYRLPTEAEWEYACRAGTRSHFHSGDDPASLAAVANVFDADAAVNWPAWKGFALATHDGFPFTAPVGSFAPNAFGLHDMHGNVWEWCTDRFGGNFYSVGPTTDPVGPNDGSRRVVRGGSWYVLAVNCRSAIRGGVTPETTDYAIGFRVVVRVAQ